MIDRGFTLAWVKWWLPVWLFSANTGFLIASLLHRDWSAMSWAIAGTVLSLGWIVMRKGSQP